MPVGDQVNAPSHYRDGRKFEPLEVFTDWDLDPVVWQVMKYLSRVGRKGDELQDLDKALFYLAYRVGLQLGLEGKPQDIVRQSAVRLVEANTPKESHHSPSEETELMAISFDTESIVLLKDYHLRRWPRLRWIRDKIPWIKWRPGRPVTDR